MFRGRKVSGEMSICSPSAGLAELPRLFEVSGGDSWTVYRFLTQHHPDLEGDTAPSALERGKVEKVLAAAKISAAPFPNLWLAGCLPRDSNRAKLNSRRSKQGPSGSDCILRATPIRLDSGSHQAGSAQIPILGICPSGRNRCFELIQSTSSGLVIRVWLYPKRIASGLSTLVQRRTRVAVRAYQSDEILIFRRRNR